jgi:hypothetical protein
MAGSKSNQERQMTKFALKGKKSETVIRGWQPNSHKHIEKYFPA